MNERSENVQGSTDECDFWSHDSFTDAVTSALIATYETRIDPNCSYENHPGLTSINETDLYRVRRHGLMIPAPDRLVYLDHFDSAGGIPKSACVAAGSHRPIGADKLQSYCLINYCKQLERFPTGVRRSAMGTPYELITLYPQDSGIVIGLRSCLVLKPNGEARLQRASWTPVRPIDEEEEKLHLSLTSTLQLQEDLQNQWTVTALTDNTRVTVGAYAESIKSILYARTLPLTASGRKRPILHLVEAHRRRLQSGIEIDINEFLRGSRLVHMDGIQFRVDPSKVLADKIKGNKAAKL